VAVIERFQFLTNLTPDALGLEPAAQYHERTEVAGAEINCLTTGSEWLGLNRRIALELELHSGSGEDLAHVVLSAPPQRRLGKGGWWRQVGAQCAEEMALTALRSPIAQPEFPPGRRTRASSAAATWWHGANMQPNVDSTTSKLLAS
jgi:hypothetical protein